MKKDFVVTLSIPDELYRHCGEDYWEFRVFVDWQQQLNEFASQLKLSDPHYREFVRKAVAEQARKK